MKFNPLPFLFFPILLIMAACGNNAPAERTDPAATAPKGPAIKEETVTFQADTATLNGFVVFDANKTGKLPVVLVIPEWWGLNDYAKGRARQLAELGYLAFAVDMYGNGKIAANPQEAQQYATPFYQNPALGKGRIEAALAKARSYGQVDGEKVGAIGYCFGGAMVLNAVRQGVPFDGVVSFHGNLAGPAPVAEAKNSEVLVLHGADDKFVSPQEIAGFKKQMDSLGVRYTFKEYPGATHAFTNPDATEAGKKFNIPIAYNAEADAASWQEMKAFFRNLFGM
jgi:dienelactone hydrolase